MTLLIKVALGAVLVYVALIAAMTLAQGAMIFPRWAMTGAAPALPHGAHALSLTLPDGTRLAGHLVPGSDPSRPLLLGFGGNAWHADALALMLHRIAPDHAVASFGYRGYPPSTGKPSAAAIMSDAIALHDLLAAQAKDGIIAIGLSIGSGPASHLAAARDLKGVVLVTPFDRLSEVARDSFPFAPVKLLFHHEMDVLGALTRSPAPLALIAATDDEVIPTARLIALRDGLAAAGRRPVHDQSLAAGHNSLYSHPDFAPELRAALAALQR